MDVLAWAVAAALAIYLRFGLTFPEEGNNGFWRILLLVAVLQVLTGYAIGLYRRRWRYGSYDEVAALGLTAVITTTGLYLLNEHYSERPIPQSAVLVGGLFGLVLMKRSVVWRLVLEWLRRPTDRTAEKLLIFGAGEGGLRVITALLRSRSSPYASSGSSMTNPSKQRLSIMGVSVMGDRSAMARAAAKTGAEILLVAVPSANAKTIGEIADQASAAGLTVKVLPAVNELFEQPVGVGDIRDLSEADLPRAASDRDERRRNRASPRRQAVLVTGAGGSIGSELCRQLKRFQPAELMMLDHDESALHQVQLSIYGRRCSTRRDDPRRHPRRRDHGRTLPTAGPRSSSTPPP